MTRTEYIEKLEDIRVALLNLGAEFNEAIITDENDIESKRRKTAGKLFDNLGTILYENGAISKRIHDENVRDGIGEQGDLFEAHPDGEVDDGGEPEQEPEPEPEEVALGLTRKAKGKRGKKSSKKGGK